MKDRERREAWMEVGILLVLVTTLGVIVNHENLWPGFHAAGAIVTALVILVELCACTVEKYLSDTNALGEM